MPSIAGPKRPQDRIALSSAQSAFQAELADYLKAHGEADYDEALKESFPASDVPSTDAHAAEDRSVKLALPTGESVSISDGAVVIAAITSCTNTSNPSVMVAAGLVAKKAHELGVTRKPW